MTTYEWLRYLSTLDGEHTALEHFRSITLAPKVVNCSPNLEEISLIEERDIELIDSGSDGILNDDITVQIVELDENTIINQEGNINGVC